MWVKWLISFYCVSERDIKILRPLYSVEVTETEIARFETEISEDDVHGNWKLKEEKLRPTAVSFNISNWWSFAEMQELPMLEIVFYWSFTFLYSFLNTLTLFNSNSGLWN